MPPNHLQLPLELAERALLVGGQQREAVQNALHLPVRVESVALSLSPYLVIEANATDKDGGPMGHEVL